MIKTTNVILVQIFYLAVYTIVVMSVGALFLSHSISEPVTKSICSKVDLQTKEAVVETQVIDDIYAQSGDRPTLRKLETVEEEPINVESCEPRIKTIPGNCSTDRDAFSKLIQERRKLVQERCKSLKEHRQVAVPAEKWFLDKIGTKGISYCPIFKAASSFTEAHFCPPYFSDKICADIGANQWRGKGVNKRKAPSGTPKLLTVRNPFDRVLSAYRDKIQALKPENPYRKPIFDEIVRHHRFISFEDHGSRDKLLNEAKAKSKTIPYERGVSVYVKGSTNPYLNPVSATFLEFIKNLLTDHWRNEHWAEMTGRCAPCKENYEFILKTEEYVCEFPMFLDAVGASNIQIDSNKKSNVNNARKDAQYSDVFEYYGQLHDEEIDAFVEWYKDDCFLFDYDCERLACEIKEWKRRNNL